MSHAKFRAKLVAFALTTTALAGCAIPHTEPLIPVIEAKSVGLSAGAPVAPAKRWWLTLNDRQLDRIMDDALAGNPSLEEAMARVRAARERIGEAKADRLPQIGVDAEADRELLTGKGEIPPPFAGTTRWVADSAANFSWTIDFAGRQKALIDRSQSEADASRLDLAAARVVLTGAVAQAYVGLARAEERQRIAQEFVASRTESLRLAETRLHSDLDTKFDIEAAKTLLAEAQQADAGADGDRAVAVHALAALAGHGADYYSTIGPAVVDLETALPLPSTLPANLLERRADLLAAKARLDAAWAGRRVARADFFPTVDLRAFLGVSALGMSQLLASQALTYGTGPAVHIPIFEGGRLRAQYNEATADIDVAAASYDDLALHAIRDAADSLSLIDTTAIQIARQREVVDGLAETVHLDQVRSRAGLGSRLDVLASGERMLQARQTETDLETQGAEQRIRLLIAVGGDFDPKPSSISSVAGNDFAFGPAPRAAAGSIH